MEIKFTIVMKYCVVVIGMEKNDKKIKIKINLNTMWYG